LSCWGGSCCKRDVATHTPATQTVLVFKWRQWRFAGCGSRSCSRSGSSSGAVAAAAAVVAAAALCWLRQSELQPQWQQR
jgi:hypothetical protein